MKPSQKGGAASFPVVGLGASAGGLKALQEFFATIPADSGMAFVVVMHLSPKHPSRLSQLLKVVAPVPVKIIEDGEAVEPNNIYVIPPDKQVSVSRGRLHVQDLVESLASRLIDAFLQSLALDMREYAVGVILSGNGRDGTLGLQEIKANDGLTVAQTPDSAEHDGMPYSAIEANLADQILPPGQIFRTIADFFTERARICNAALSTGDGADSKWLYKIFGVLRSRLGHDFTHYKVNSMNRRVSRRMGLLQIVNPEDYIRILRENPEEADALFRELLIGVTSFFRDPDSYKAIKRKALPGILDDLPENANIRVWVPGCSTGEEAYSLAIVIKEMLYDSSKRLNLQIFATDIDPRAIEIAREGRYSSIIEADVSADRLKRCFIKEGAYYRIRKEIRDCIIFSDQNILKILPFHGCPFSVAGIC